MALRHEVGIFDPADGSVPPHRRDRGRADRETRLNDGKVGPDGAFWVGTMDDRDRPVKQPLGSLYRVDGHGRVEKKIDGPQRLQRARLLAGRHDVSFRFERQVDRLLGRSIPRRASSPTARRIAELDDATGARTARATDAEGFYWSAGVSAARLNRFSPEGKLVGSFPVPVAAPTMPCFGGRDLKTLFVTSLKTGRSPELLARYPLTGTTIAAASVVAGCPVSRFREG